MNFKIENGFDARDRLYEALRDFALDDGLLKNGDALGFERKLHIGLVPTPDGVERRIKKVMEFVEALGPPVPAISSRSRPGCGSNVIVLRVRN